MHFRVNVAGRTSPRAHTLFSVGFEDDESAGDA